jgi:SET domain-containing protein
MNPFKPTKKHKETKLKEQINLLHEVVKLKLAPSAIHGVGVHALRDIKKGEKLYTDIIPHQLDLPYSKFKHLDKDIRDILLGHFPLIIEGSHFMYPVTKMSAYLNHSNTPNYDAKEDKALKDIKKGEEVTEDYRSIPNYEKIFPWIIN